MITPLTNTQRKARLSVYKFLFLQQKLQTGAAGLDEYSRLTFCQLRVSCVNKSRRLSDGQVVRVYRGAASHIWRFLLARPPSGGPPLPPRPGSSSQRSSAGAGSESGAVTAPPAGRAAAASGTAGFSHTTEENREKETMGISAGVKEEARQGGEVSVKENKRRERERRRRE